MEGKITMFDSNFQKGKALSREVSSNLFHGQIGMDQWRKITESHDGKTALLFCMAGREIIIATLKGRDQ